MSFDLALQAKLDQIFQKINRPTSPGCTVGIIRNGELIASPGYGMASLEYDVPITSKTVFRLGSCAKHFTGMCIALLEENNQIFLDDNIRTYLPEFPDYGSPITIGNLLYHTSGIRDYFVLVYFMMGRMESDFVSEEEVLELLVKQKGLVFSPGEKHFYSNSNYFLLSQIIKQVTSRPLAEFAHKEIFNPLNMKSTHFQDNHSLIIKNRATGYAKYQTQNRSTYLYDKDAQDDNYICTSTFELVGDGGLFSSIEDLVLWDQNFYNNRLGQGKPDLIEKVLRPGKLTDGTNTPYAYGLYVNRFSGRKYTSHLGAFGGYTTIMDRFPDENLSIFCLANTQEIAPHEYLGKLRRLFFTEESTKSENVSSPTKDKVIKLSKEELQTKMGSYQNPVSSSIWEISLNGSQLSVHVNRGLRFEIIPVSPYVFKIDNQNMSLVCKFEEIRAGVHKIIVSQGNEQSIFTKFIERPLNTVQLDEYKGSYYSDELDTTYEILVHNVGLVMQNKNRHNCALDFVYTPTILDHFVHYNPYVGSMHLQFLRNIKEKTRALVFKDYDGDKREQIEFKKMI